MNARLYAPGHSRLRTFGNRNLVLFFFFLRELWRTAAMEEYLNISLRRKSEMKEDKKEHS